MMKTIYGTLVIAVGLSAFLVMTARVDSCRGQESTQELVDFNRDIRPVLAQYCFKCHGTDEHSREAGLRLDDRESAIAKSDSGSRAIVAHDPDSSELIRRVFSTESDLVMPPQHTKSVMPDKAKQLLRRWIASGAKYDKHWAYVAPNSEEIDRLLNSRSSEESKLNPIDYFVRQKLKQMKLDPSPMADRYTLVRRVYLDLVGIPATPQEADEFVADQSPEAYERLVDRLLASKQYGERWARRWLDLARYADTNGFEKDRPRQIWPFRDWVIAALNDDMPYDQFSIKQLAGDLLPNATPDDLIATGFHRNTMLNEEGGIDPLEYRFYAMVDRVGVTGATWLGLTMNCAQCHTHKYDPIEHSDFYRLMAFLNNADEPSYYIPPTDETKFRKDQLDKVAKLTAELPDKFPGGVAAMNESLARWIGKQSEQSSLWEIVTPSSVQTNMPHLEIQADGYLLGSGDITKSDVYDLTLKAPIANVRALKIEVASHPSLPAGGPGLTYYEGPIGGFFLSEFQVFQGENRLKITDAEATNDPVDDKAKSPASENKNKSTAGEKTKQPKKSLAAASLDGDMSSGWQVLGGFDVYQAAVFHFEQPINLADGLQLKMLFEKHYACSLGHFRISVTSSDTASATGLSPEVETILATSKMEQKSDNSAIVALDKFKESDLTKLRQYFLEHCPELAPAAKEIIEARRLQPRGQQTLVFKERPASNPRATLRYHRGEFLQPLEQVEPGVPAFLPPLNDSAETNRLSFARWLFSSDHPLTARVAVNRQWQAFFGRGLVKSLDDFGYQSEPPTHPQLLDWLAIEFVRGGWSLKKLHRLIVTSQTYQQSSKVSPEHSQLDPENVWLARGARFRLEAEIIRDSALQAAGVLSKKMGGPGVYPPQPASVTTEGTYGRIDWKTSEGEDRYRRSIYTFMKRTAPFAMATTFDAPSGESCLARREVSNSPLQALTLLNDQMFFEVAQAMSKSAMTLADTDESRVKHIFRSCVTRPPTDEELQRIKTFVDVLRQRKLDEPNLWTVVSRAIMNLDESITHP